MMSEVLKWFSKIKKKKKKKETGKNAQKCEAKYWAGQKVQFFP